MVNIFKTYCSIFGYLTLQPNTLIINNNKYVVPMSKKIFMKFLSFIYILFPVFTGIITNKIDKTFELSLLSIIGVYILIYMTMIIIVGKVTNYFLCNKILKKDE